MKIVTGIIILLIGIFIAYTAIKSLIRGKTENLEDGFPPIVRKKSPVHFYFSTITSLLGGTAFIVFGILMLWVLSRK
jgi:ABC-type uncharacterized transport system permease subunit